MKHHIFNYNDDKHGWPSKKRIVKLNNTEMYTFHFSIQNINKGAQYNEWKSSDHSPIKIEIDTFFFVWPVDI